MQYLVRLKDEFDSRDSSRKEVIHPQIPLRIPCYDFTPIADPSVVLRKCGTLQDLPTLLV